jgi:DNA replication protein DnaC
MTEPNTVTSLDDLRKLQERDPPIKREPISLAKKLIPVEERIQKTVSGGILPTDEEIKAREENQRRWELLAVIAKDLGARYSPQRATLERFEIGFPEQAAVKKRLEEILKDLPAMVERGAGIVFFGEVGTGKDHLQAILLYAAARAGISCRRINAQDWYGKMRDRMDAGLNEEEVLSGLCQPQVLAISDPVPPASQLQPFRLELLYRVINRRYEAMRPTWMAMNALSTEQAEQHLGSPVWDRLQDSAELIPCLWPSYRERRLKPYREESAS